MEETKKSEEKRPAEAAGEEDPLLEILKQQETAMSTRRDRATKLIISKTGLTKEQLDDWKKKCGRIEAQCIRGKWYVYRGLSRLEWQKLADEEAAVETTGAVSDSLKRESRVVNNCLLFPSNLEVAAPAEAGVPSVLYAHILNFSGFEPDLPEPIEL